MNSRVNLLSILLNVILLIVVALMIVIPKITGYGVTLSQYTEVEQGMSYVDVCYIFKQDGVVLCDLNNVNLAQQTNASNEEYNIAKLSSLNGVGGSGKTEIVEPNSSSMPKDKVENTANSIADMFKNAGAQEKDSVDNIDDVVKTIEDTANSVADMFKNTGPQEKDFIPNVKIVKWQGKASKDSYCLITFVNDKVQEKVQEGLK